MSIPGDGGSKIDVSVRMLVGAFWNVHLPNSNGIRSLCDTNHELIQTRGTGVLRAPHYVMNQEPMAANRNLSVTLSLPGRREQNRMEHLF